jgi:hypothetical protein
MSSTKHPSRRGGKPGKVRAAAVLLAVAFLVTLISLSVPGCSWFGSDEKKPEKKAAAEEAEPLTCPLCGLPVEGQPAIDRRPIAVKIGNDPEARPQSGLDKPCVVFEELTEGGITRFMAVYLCREADLIGPVRSARPADIEIAFPYNALFCHCGGGPDTLAALQASGLADLDEMAWTGAYWRIRERRAPHNLYTSTSRLRSAGDGAFPFHGEVTGPFEFLTDKEQAKMEKERARETKKTAAEQSDPTGTYTPSVTVVNNIYIPYQSLCAVKYTYDATTGRFLRFVSGAPHIENTSAAQLAADNVIVQYVTETPSGVVDVRGANSPDLGVLGSGRAQVFVRGQLIDANWQKSSRAEYTTYTDNAGEPVKLKPGVTWIELVPASGQATFD